MQHTDNNDILELSLARITFLSCKEKLILAKKLDSYNTLALLSIEEISKLIGRNFSSRVNWNGSENLKMAQFALQYCQKMGIQLLHYNDKEYPELLRQIADPPYLLFCRGNLSVLQERSVSVVGTRRLTPQGKAAALNFSYDAVRNGCTVVSGLARGADACAHQGAVNAYYDALESDVDTKELGRTIAVLPSSIDEIVPAGNKKLAEQILKTGGCIISEYEPRMTIANWHFVGRNRIIAALSPATVVVEAPAGSGALITADFALDFGRDVMFHEASFTQLAKEVSENVQNTLKARAVTGKVSQHKLENTAEKFVKAGAPIISGYEDYCKRLQEAPGQEKPHPLQQELFEENI
ncbi:MAG: DNA-processing protein DprA [Treponema sp.]|nr:DNA-processing protein DprA [Treponema sp.]